jgi:hypothetical protein
MTGPTLDSNWKRAVLATIVVAACTVATPATSADAGAAPADDTLGAGIAVPDTGTGKSKKGNDSGFDPKDFGGGFRIGFWSYMGMDGGQSGPGYGPTVGVNPGIDWYVGMWKISLDYAYGGLPGGGAGSEAFTSTGVAFPFPKVRPWIAARIGYCFGDGYCDEGVVVGPNWGVDLRMGGLYAQFSGYVYPGVEIQAVGFNAGIALGI